MMPATKALEGDRNQAILVYMDWYNDPMIAAFMERHCGLTEDESSTPSREQLIKDIYKMTKGRHTSDRDKLTAYSIICDIEGHIQPAVQTNIQMNTNVQKNVMVVESHGNDDQWKGSLIEQQKQLMDSSKDPEAQETIDAYAKAGKK